MSAKTTNVRVWWGGDVDETELTLTTSYRVSDAVDVRYSDMIYIYTLYTPAESNSTLTFGLLMSPFDEFEEAAYGDAYSPFGFYVDGSGQQQVNTTGAWEEQPAEFSNDPALIPGADQQVNLTPVRIDVTNVKFLKIKAKETTSGDAGSVGFIIAKNEY